MNNKTMNRVDFREISIPEGINAVSRVIEDKTRILPLLESNNYLEKILKARWVEKEIKADAQESLMGVLQSIENNLQKQTELHSKNLIATYNYNASLLTTKILLEHNLPAKVFSLVGQPKQIIDVEGQGFTWRLHSIDESEEIVPTKFLERLTILKYNSIIPDSMYVGVPIGEQKPKFCQVVKSDVNSALDLLSDVVSGGMLGYNGISAASSSVQLPDPLLICGFGTSPLFLVQIGKWL